MDLYKKLKEFGKVKINEPLSKHTTFKIGGPADFFVIVDSTDKLVELLNFLIGEGIEYFLIGGGSNMLVSDEGFLGVVISTINNKQITIEDEVVVVEAGATTALVAQESMRNNLTGFEWGVGVPGTIGGAVRGNAGATGSEIKDTLKKVEVYRDGEVIELDNKDCKFGYRNSIFKHNTDIILRVYLRLEKSQNKVNGEAREDALGYKELMKIALGHLQYRNKTQPQGYSSTGCIFKNFTISGVAKLRNLNIPKEFIDSGKIPAGW